ncbi:type II toxin-antitoxin system mRNA interferase toxin, RelE/StbE family [bacterium]|nr:MAG: type II toxin-antitoxin system mRNA interferase toxin, RelE/StbE family [bacterium]
MYAVTSPRQFLRQARKFFAKHPDLKPRFKKLLEALQKDPFRPSLKLHPLSGKLSDCYAVSLAFSYRVTLTLIVEDKEIILLDIGSHDEVYERK